MATKQLSFIFLLTFATISCRQGMESKLIGKWQAVSVVSNGKLMDIIPQVIWLELKTDNTYRFQSTPNYTEKGKFSVVKDLLYTQDLLFKDSPQKVVQIIAISSSECQILMKANGIDQIMTMKRVE
jgi:hypothetical protein